MTKLLARRPVKAVLACADRLLPSRKREVRLGGLEVMRLLTDEGKGLAECQKRVEAYYAAHADIDNAERSCLEAIRDADKPKPTLDDALGLMQGERGKFPVPKMRKMACMSKAAVACRGDVEVWPFYGWAADGQPERV